MIANYHTHTYRCRHASGTEEEYIYQALDGGLEELGFSDHTPYWFPGDYYSTFRMFPEELTDYVQTVLFMKEHFERKIKIHLGLEVEYYPEYFSELMKNLRQHPIEYMILGQHYVGNEIGGRYTGAYQTDDTAMLEQYCDQVIAGIQTDLFSCVAHPDILGFTGDEKVYNAQMHRLCTVAKAHDVPLEINLLGIRGGRHYPEPKFWRIAAEVGCKCILGSDAHRAVDVCDAEGEDYAMRMVRAFRLNLQQTMELRPIR